MKGWLIGRGVLMAAFFVAAAALTTAASGPERTLVGPDTLEHNCLTGKLSSGMPTGAQWQRGAIVQDPAGAVMLVLTTRTASLVCTWDNPHQVSLPGMFSGTISTSGRLECPGVPGDGWTATCLTATLHTNGTVFAGRVPDRTARLAITYPDHQVLTTDVTSGTIALFGPQADLTELLVRAFDGTGKVLYDGPLVPRTR